MDKYRKQAYIDMLNDTISQYPTVKMDDALGTLMASKEEMDKVKKTGYDNYAHRLGMCLNAQKGLDSAIYSLAGGTLKEVYDFIRKAPKIGISKALDDGKKDMKNNLEGLSFGLTNPDKSCRVWLQDLDYGANQWKK